jgi:PHD/YefM family antitoxin component YafN of YafNO toxin-antitoxin module
VLTGSRQFRLPEKLGTPAKYALRPTTIVIEKGALPMNQVQLTDQLYKEAERRAREAGFDSVDEFIAERLEIDFSEEQENFDDRFTPEVLAHLDRIADDVAAGNSVSPESVDKHLAEARESWLKNRAG